MYLHTCGASLRLRSLRQAQGKPFGFAPFDSAPFDFAPFDSAQGKPFDSAPFDSAQGKEGKQGRPFDLAHGKDAPPQDMADRPAYG